VSGALLGESLNLSPSPQLGHYYLVPYANKATFQLGYKGFLQLAERTGNYRKIIAQPIKEGELISYNPLEEELKINPILDDTTRENAKTIGYYAMFEYINGFRKVIYWSKEKMENHAIRYSKGYQAKKGYTFWEKDFDAMACKTMLRQLISKWGIMSTDMQIAYQADQSVINADGSVDYIDNNTINYHDDRKVVDVL
jgi:recombination protein RecT